MGAPLARLGYWRIGGPAEALVEVHTPAQLLAALGLGAPVTVLGNGSNLLIADAGVPGVTLRLAGALADSDLDVEAGVATVGGGLRNAVLLSRLQRAGLGGLGCLAGIPGTLGGAVRMNAGWRLGEIADVLLDADVVLPGEDAVRTLTAAELGFAYRRAAGLPAGAVVASARLQLLTDPAAVAAERDEVRRWLGRRKESQPLDKPSCGSVFKNPPGDYAGRLIEAAGLKGHRIGGAAISDRHANFIVNLDGARAQDVYDLVALARRVVFAEAGVELEPEVVVIGDWGARPWPPPLR